MRIIIAVAMFLLSTVLVLLGIAERTVWAPEPTKAISISIDAARPFVIVPNSVLKLHSGTPVVKVAGPGHVYVATGREDDIRAWIGGSSKTEIAYDSKTKKLSSQSLEGVDPSADPTGSDLWRTERSALTKVSAKVDAGQGGAVLLASDGLSPAPDKLTIEWQRNYDLTPSNLLIYSGEALLVITLIYNIFLFRSIRNSRRPRRRLPKAPHGPRSRPKRKESTLPRRGRRVAGRNYSWIPATFVVVGLLSGCAPSSTAPTPTPTETSDSASAAKPAALQMGQIRRIITSVSSVAKAGDTAHNSAALLPRFFGPALEMRDAAYNLIKKTRKAPALETIYSSPITVSLPAATDQWPRTLMVVTGAQKKRLPILLVLRQMHPREQYQVWYSTTLVSGVKLPRVAAVADGAVPVPKDSAYLTEQPINLPTIYGEVIDKGSESLHFGKFALAQDSFYSQISKIQQDQLKSLTKAKLAYQHVLANDEPLGLATADGGALVAVYMKDITTIKPTKRNSGITVNTLEQVILGAKGSIKGVVSTYGDMLLFYVPSVGQNSKITLLGWQAGLLKVKSL
ncbi:MAG: hypothetical protein RLZZ06_903 [Actinomycetota bacterium]|jgi:hypothetical protein